MKKDGLTAPILSALMGEEDFYCFDVREELPSTNVALKEIARQNPDMPEGLVLIAERQSQGHGRYARHFSSPKGGVYMSILLRPRLPLEKATLITAAAAVAVAEAAEELTGLDFSIKWVNDVYRNGRKIAGILTEGGVCASGDLAYAVLGIGLNVLPPETAHPEAIASLVGRVFEEESHAPENPRASAIASVLKHFLSYYRRLSEKGFLEGYRARSLLTGKRISFEEEGRERTATVLGIDDECRLTVCTEEGVVRHLQSGEVQLTAF